MTDLPLLFILAEVAFLLLVIVGLVILLRWMRRRPRPDGSDAAQIVASRETPGLAPHEGD